MRQLAVLALLALLVIGAALAAVAWLVPAAPSRRSPATSREAAAAAPAAAEAPPQPGLVMAPVPRDPAEMDRLAALAEARAGYAALRDAYVAGQPSSVSQHRLEPALRSLWPDQATWGLTCRGLVCRVTPRPGPGGWQVALQEHAAVREVAERTVFDPDSASAPAYVQLLPKGAAAAPAGQAEQFLEGIEAAVLASPDVAQCLADAEPGRSLELHLALDATGLTYRMGAGLGPQPSLCASMALTPIMASPVPAGIGSGTRTFQVQRR
jgi:hypothetical protein